MMNGDVFINAAICLPYPIPNDITAGNLQTRVLRDDVYRARVVVAVLREIGGRKAVLEAFGRLDAAYSRPHASPFTSPEAGDTIEELFLGFTLDADDVNQDLAAELMAITDPSECPILSTTADDTFQSNNSQRTRRRHRTCHPGPRIVREA